ncbi:hypothetical protein [Sphingobium sp.]|uniref:hypothetical protein n=1 Tax=Sphingobium sp. TaxID=1912891 RepID=UPI000DB0E2FA|nr:hypothetical protein [Sphingobium sp.]PZU65253.1 MAG: hypothetical protein DI540_17955 [Sphingobium sp.]
MNESFGIRIASDPPARLWGGFGDLEIPADIVEDAPAIYLGGGELLNAPDFEIPINATAERLDIRISGVSSSILPIFLAEAASVKGAKVHFVRFYFDDDWQLEDVEYDTVWRADKISIVSEDNDGRTRTIILSIATEDTNRNRSPQAFFTDQDQRRRSPTDAIFSHVSQITQGLRRRFEAR